MPRSSPRASTGCPRCCTTSSPRPTGTAASRSCASSSAAPSGCRRRSRPGCTTRPRRCCSRTPTASRRAPRRAASTGTSASTIRWTSTRRVRSRRPWTRSPSASFTTTPACPVTKSCAVPVRPAPPQRSAPGSTGSSTNSRSGRTRHATSALPDPPHPSRFAAMDMAAKFQDQTVFHMTGKRAGEGLAELAPGLRPALLAAYRDLTRLRYDYPVVLLERDAGGHYVKSLSTVMGELIAGIAPRGIEGERVRKQLLRLEREIRTLSAGGARGSLKELWLQAVDKAAGRDDDVRIALREAVASLEDDGEVIDCDRTLAARFLSRAWHAVHAEKANQFRSQVDHLVRRLSDIL